MRKVWLATVNMGYGHQRSAYPLKDLAYKGEVINANDYPGIPESDKKIWEQSRVFYEAISKFKRAPLIGDAAFGIFDKFQRIIDFYPKKDLSAPNFAVKQMYRFLRKGWGKDLIERFSKRRMPLLTTFFTPAFMAEYFNYPEDIYVVVCDADISRAWAPLEPMSSRINYFAPNERVYERLKMYGIRKKNIFLSGFPLPSQNLSSQDGVRSWKMDVLVQDLRYRLKNLDPREKYYERYKVLIRRRIGSLPSKSNHILTILFSVGGAGAQKEIGAEILNSLAFKIKNREVKIIVSAGIKEDVKNYFDGVLDKLGLKKCDGAQIIYERDLGSYFKKFNAALRKTDILWTKPSELSFYAGLGIPIIIASTIGSHENFNKRWLLENGFGLMQEDPSCVNQWLYDWLDQGYLAEAAMEGFIEGEKFGVYNITHTICRRAEELGENCD